MNSGWTAVNAAAQPPASGLVMQLRWRYPSSAESHPAPSAGRFDDIEINQSLGVNS